jgi:hypothetical protein
MQDAARRSWVARRAGRRDTSAMPPRRARRRLRGQRTLHDRDGINDGDFVIVDPDQPVVHGDIAVFIVRTEKGTAMMIKRLDRSQGIRLVPSNPAYQAITINHEDNLLILGKVVLTYRPHEQRADSAGPDDAGRDTRREAG